MEGSSTEKTPSIDKYRKIITGLTVSLILALLVIVILAVLLYQAKMSQQPSNQSMPQYYHSTSTTTPLNKPNMNDVQIRNWAATAIVSAHSYSYSDYHKSFNNLTQYYSPEALKQYLKHLHTSGTLEAVTRRKLTVSAVPRAAAIILKQGESDGKYTWYVEIPLLVTYQTKNEIFKQDVLTILTIQRIPMQRNSSGIIVKKLTIHRMH